MSKNPEELGTVLFPCSPQKKRGGERITSRVISPFMLVVVKISEDWTDALKTILGSSKQREAFV